jgi:hypothetical protein
VSTAGADVVLQSNERDFDLEQNEDSKNLRDDILGFQIEK